MDSSEADRWKKLGQIERGDHGLASMDLRAAEAGAARDKAVGATMYRDGGQDLVQNSPLDGFQPWLGRLDQAQLPCPFADKGIAIMLERGFDRTAVAPALIGQPVELVG